MNWNLQKMRFDEIKGIRCYLFSILSAGRVKTLYEVGGVTEEEGVAGGS